MNSLWTLDFFIAILMFSHIGYIGWQKDKTGGSIVYAGVVILFYGYMTCDVLAHSGLIVGAIVIYVTSLLMITLNSLKIMLGCIIAHAFAILSMLGAHFAMWDNSMLWTIPLLCTGTLAMQAVFLYRGETDVIDY